MIPSTHPCERSEFGKQAGEDTLLLYFLITGEMLVTFPIKTRHMLIIPIDYYALNHIKWYFNSLFLKITKRLLSQKRIIQLLLHGT